MGGPSFDVKRIGGFLGIPLTGFKLINKNPNDGYVVFQATEVLSTFERVDEIIVHNSGVVTSSILCKPKGRSNACAYEKQLEVHNIDADKAKAALAAVGETIDPKFKKAHEPLIEALTKRFRRP